MYIKEIVLQGFKSYPNRTVVGPFDPSFNAITGLNGSGKSNILDSICFVLGISNLQQVRVSSLQELVYKQGQAGVTKASVTIVFDNSDRNQSPVGYEDLAEITVTREVAIGSRNKYLINGHVAQQGRVQNLFHSVQLNINNPHFLIMQGRITKVMNMKPHEILAMVEEVAGTRMFEVKKKSALQTIEKKHKKVQEIDNVLTNELGPTLEKLGGERSAYLRWSANASEIERLQRFCIAHEFHTAETALARFGEEEEGLATRRDDVNKALDENSTAIANIIADIESITARREDEASGELGRAEASAAEASKALVKSTALWKHKTEAVAAEEDALAKAQGLASDADTTIAARAEELDAARQTLADAEERAKGAEKSLEDLQRKLQAVCAGVNADAEGETTLVDQLMESKRTVAQAGTTAKQSELKIAHLDKELKTKRKEVAKFKTEIDKMKADTDKAEQQVQKVKDAMGKINFDAGRHEQLLARQSKAHKSVKALRHQVDQLSAKLAHLDFSYTDPTPNFDRRKVRGLVANLVEIGNPEHVRALEVAAGNRLFNVVVDTEQTGKQLLQHGKLRRKVTIIPLNKIAGRPIKGSAIARAKSLGGKGNVHHALELVGYDADVDAAMEYVFGGALVCRDMDTAKAVTFDRDVRAKSVTLDGDVFDPAGTLTGGSRPNGASILARLHELNDKRGELERAEEELGEIEADLEASAAGREQHSQLARDLELHEHQLTLAESRHSQSAYYQAAKALEGMEAQKTEAEEALAGAQEALASGERRVADLERKIKAGDQDKKAKVAQVEKQLAGAKKEQGKASDALRKAKQRADGLALEIEQLESEAKTAKSSIGTLEAQIGELRKEAASLEEVVAEDRDRHEAAQGEVRELKDKLKSLDRELASLSKQKQQAQNKVSDLKVEAKKIEQEIKDLDGKRAAYQGRVKAILKKHTWVETEREFFGQKHTDFDFAARKIKHETERLQTLEEDQKALSKRINKKAINMYEKAMADFENLTNKKHIIEADRVKIEAVIAELDKKKNEALQTTWKKVNRDFGSIFATLLPGASAKLAPPEGMSELEGLEVRVAFGSVWKESLSELSGGQRSLLALSLILSFLLFKPAPMYVLDEVDAALDLSHTQNIGQMLRTHFTHSQFVIVSLKEGMFNNANVLFRTKFIDGVSTVIRTVPALNSGAAAAAAADKGKGKKKVAADKPKRKALAVRN